MPLADLSLHFRFSGGSGTADGGTRQRSYTEAQQFHYQDIGVGLTGRRGDIDGLVDVRWLSWSTLVAGSDPEQVLLSFNHISDGELLVLDS